MAHGEITQNPLLRANILKGAALGLRKLLGNESP